MVQIYNTAGMDLRSRNRAVVRKEGRALGGYRVAIRFRRRISIYLWSCLEQILVMVRDTQIIDQVKVKKLGLERK